MARIILTASEGMIYTDGTIYGTKIFLAEGRDPGDFYEISREEYERIMVEQEALMQEDATDADHIVREV